MREKIETAAAANDIRALLKIGRFLGPFVTEMERSNPAHQRPAAIQTVFQTPFSSSGCVQ
jgi:hypothetical protein